MEVSAGFQDNLKRTLTYPAPPNHTVAVYTIGQAKRMLSQLVKQAAKGKEIIIVRGNVPVAKLLPIKHPEHRKPGSMKGLLKVKQDTFDPLTTEELKMLGFE